MDVIGNRCHEPLSTDYLRHDAVWMECSACGELLRWVGDTLVHDSPTVHNLPPGSPPPYLTAPPRCLTLGYQPVDMFTVATTATSQTRFANTTRTAGCGSSRPAVAVRPATADRTTLLIR